ncbi:VCBS repeat-containing protein, partial [bacterium]|nr:VCBS repeat-containing protein [bacterium]
NNPDLNKDGYYDIVFGSGDNSYIYWGDSSNSYSTKTELATHNAIGNSIADLNGDGYLDIVFSNYSIGYNNNINSYIYWGDSSNSYSTKTELATHGAYGNSIADLNSDGYLDIVFSNGYDGSSPNVNSYIYWGDSSNSYSSKTELATYAARGNSIADLNGDGYLDIVFSSRGGSSSSIFWGDSSNSYSTKTELATLGSRANSIADLNGDGYPDIVFSNYSDSHFNVNVNSYIYWGDSSNSYSTRTELATHGAMGNSISDLNGDGYLDIIFANHDDDFYYPNYNINSYIYWGDPSGSYSSKTELATVGASGVSAGNISAFGQNYLPENTGAVPEPLTLFLLGIGIIGLVKKKTNN